MKGAGAIARAEEALAIGDDDEGIDALVQAWRDVRAIELAELVETLSSRLERHVTALFLAHVVLNHVSPERLASVVDDAVWATVRTLSLGYIDSAKSFPVAPSMRSLERVFVETTSGRKSLRLIRQRRTPVTLST